MYMPAYGCTDTYTPLPTGAVAHPGPGSGNRKQPTSGDPASTRETPGRDVAPRFTVSERSGFDAREERKSRSETGEGAQSCVYCVFFCGTLPCQSALARFQSPPLPSAW
jgi:hypothetical protein